MPIEITDVDDELGRLITGTGVITEEEYFKTFEKHMAQPPEKRRKYLYSLLDFTGATRVEVSMASLKSFAEMCKSASSVTTGTVIAVAAGKDVVSEPLKMWATLCHEAEWEIRIFQSNEEARNWISEQLKEKWKIVDLTFS